MKLKKMRRVDSRLVIFVVLALFCSPLELLSRPQMLVRLALAFFKRSSSQSSSSSVRLLLRGSLLVGSLASSVNSGRAARFRSVRSWLVDIVWITAR